jgi:hypothetical protein
VARRIDVARVTVDFSSVEEFEALEEREYLAEITKVEFREPQTADKYPYLNVEVTIREEGEYQGRKVWAIWSLSPKALWRAKAAWENLGVIAEDSEIELDVDEDTNLVTDPPFVGIPCMVGVKNEPYEGTMRSRAETFTATEDAKPKRGAAKKDGKAPAKAKRKFA